MQNVFSSPSRNNIFGFHYLPEAVAAGFIESPVFGNEK
jgi:hypothetical protein